MLSVFLPIVRCVCAAVCFVLSFGEKSVHLTGKSRVWLYLKGNTERVFIQIKLPAEPNKIKCLLMETEAHDVGWSLITRKRGEALVVTAFGAQRYSPGPRAALPYTSHLPHLKALTFKVAHHFPED